MHENRSHPLLEQVPLTVSPFVSLPTATTLPYTYKSMPSTLPPSSAGITATTSSSSNEPKPKYVISSSGHAAHPDDMIAFCRALQAHLYTPPFAVNMLSSWDLSSEQLFHLIKVFRNTGSTTTSQLFCQVWRLEPDLDLRLALFTALRADRNLLDLMSDRRFRSRRPRDILVTVANSSPFGVYFSELLRTNRLRCLFVAAFGDRNAVPCHRCEKVYMTSLIPGSVKGSEGMHTRWPFLECISIPGYAFGQCANCLFIGQHCSFSRCDEKDDELIKTLAATSDDGLMTALRFGLRFLAGWMLATSAGSSCAGSC